MFPKLFKALFKASGHQFFAPFATFFVAFSLFLAIGALSGGAISAVEERSRPFLSADVSVSSSYPLGDAESAVLGHCAEVRAQCVRRISFQSTFLDAQNRPVPVSVVAVDSGYPFYGTLEVRPVGRTGSGSELSVRSDFPSPSGFLADTSVFAAFGSGASFELFGKKLLPEGEILRSPPSSGFSFGADPWLAILAYDWVAASSGALFGSRADFAILAKAPDSETAKRLAELWRNDPATSKLRVRTPRQSSGGAGGIADDVDRYAGTAVAVAFLLAATAAYFFASSILAANRRFFATLKLLGASRWRSAMLFLAFFLIPAILALAVSLAWYGAFAFFGRPGAAVPLAFSSDVPIRLLAAFPFVVLPPVVPAIAKLLAPGILAGFSEPRPAIPNVRTAANFAIPAFLALAAFRFTGTAMLSESFVWAGYVTLSAVAVLALSAWSVAYFARKAPALKKRSFPAFDAFRLAWKPGSPAFPTVAAFAVPAVLLAFFSSFAFHFSSELSRLTGDAADAFVLNIREKDLDAVGKIPALKTEAYSMLRARVVSVNGKTLSEHLGDGEGEVSREFTREFNVTASPLKDRIESGKKDPVSLGEVSADRDFADRLGLALRDRVTFSVMGREFPLSVVAIRESSRQGIRPFFYFQVAKGEFSGAPVSYFMAVNVADVGDFQRRVIESVGSHVSFVDVRETVSLIRDAVAAVLPAVWAFLGSIALLAFSVAFAVLSSVRRFRVQRERTYGLIGSERAFLRKEAFFASAFVFASAFSVSALAAFPAAWGALIAAPFLQFSFSAATASFVLTFAFVVFGVAVSAAWDRAAG